MTADLLPNSKTGFECTLFYEVLYLITGKLEGKKTKDKKKRRERGLH
jgi:hypothetical protein